MPSVDDVDFAESDWFELQKKTLNTFFDKIVSCIEHSEWETLVLVLESRHVFLQQLYSNAPEQYKAQLKLLAEATLQQDAVFQSRVEQQKHLVMQQQMTIDRGRRAVNAYNGH